MRNWKEWDKADLDLLRKPLSNSEVSKITGRSKGAITQARAKFGIPLTNPDPKGDPWSPEQVEALSLPLPASEVAKLINRTASAVKQARLKRSIPTVYERPRLHPSTGPAGTPKYRSTVWAQWQMRKGHAPRVPDYLGLRPLAWTCTGCGTLRTCPDGSLKSSIDIAKCVTCSRRSSSEFGKNARATNDPKYKTRVRKYVKAQNDETVASATRHRYTWTGPELDMALRKDLTIRQIATALGRSIYAVRAARAAALKDPRKARLVDTDSR